MMSKGWEIHMGKHLEVDGRRWTWSPSDGNLFVFGGEGSPGREIAKGLLTPHADSVVAVVSEWGCVDELLPAADADGVLIVSDVDHDNILNVISGLAKSNPGGIVVFGEAWYMGLTPTDFDQFVDEVGDNLVIVVSGNWVSGRGRRQRDFFPVRVAVQETGIIMSLSIGFSADEIKHLAGGALICCHDGEKVRANITESSPTAVSGSCA